jgi:hypothetical protein
MQEEEAMAATLGPAERLALATRRASQQTADRLARKGLSRFVKGPPRRAYARNERIGIDLTPLGEKVALAALGGGSAPAS